MEGTAGSFPASGVLSIHADAGTDHATITIADSVTVP
jgi:hypothetical protein